MSRHHAGMKRSAWDRLRRSILERDGYRCRSCGKAGILEVHHVKDLQYGGTNDPDNLAVLCRGCHIDVHRKHPPACSRWKAAVDEME